MDSAGLIDEIIAVDAAAQVVTTTNDIEKGTEALLVFAKAAREASTAVLSVNSNGQLTKAYNDAAIAQSKLATQTDELGKLQARLVQLEADLAKAVEAGKEATERKTKARNEETEAIKRQQAEEKELNRLIKEEEKSNNTAAKLKDIAARKEAAAAIKDQQAQEKELLRLIKEEERVNLAQKRKEEAQAQRDKATADREYIATYKQLLKERDAEEKQLATLTNDYGLLSTAYNEAALRAKNLQIQLGENNPVAVAATKDAAALGAELKRLDASVGQHSRSVGDYKIAYNGLSNSIQQILRETPSAAVSLNTFFLAISNNLPIFFDEIQKINQAQKEANILLKEQVVIARENATATALQAGATAEAAAAEGALAAATVEANAAQKAAPSLMSQIGKSIFSFNTLLTLGVLALTLFGGKIISAFGGASEATKKADEETKRYNDSLKEIDKTENATAQTAITRIGILTKLAQDQGLADKKRLDAVHELQKTYPNTFGALKEQEILEGKLGDAVNKTTEALIKRAYAQAAEKKLIETGQQRFELDQRQLELTEKIRIAQENIDKNIINASKTRGDAGDRAALNIGKEGAALKDLTDEYNTNTKKLKDNDNAARTLGRTILRNAEDVGTTLDTPDKAKTKTPRDTTNKDVKLLQDQTKAIADEFAKRALLQAEEQKLIADNEENSLQVRLQALANYYKKKDEAIKISNQAEVDATQKALDAIAILEKKKAGGGTLTNQEADLVGEKKLLEQRLTNIQLQGQIDRSKNLDDYNKANLAAVKKASTEEIAAIFRELDTVAADRAKQYATEKEALDKSYKERKISTKDYNNAVKALNVEYARDTYNQQIELLQNDLLFTSYTTEAYDRIIAKIKELEAARDGLGKNPVKRDDSGGILGFSEKDKKDLANVESYTDAASAAFQGVSDVLDQISAKRRAQIDAEIAAIDKRTQAEINGINKSSATQEEKDELIAEANAKADAQKEQLANKQKQRDIADARRQKALKIAQIVVETALAVIHQLGSGDPYTAFARAIAVGVIGAANLAVAIASPIPSFAEGTEYFKGGWARFGEAGTELVKEPNKAPYLVHSETIAPLPRGTRIIPEDKIMQSTYASMLSPQVILSLQKEKADNEGVEKRLDRWGYRHEQALKQLKPKPQTKSIFGSQNPNWINN